MLKIIILSKFLATDFFFETESCFVTRLEYSGAISAHCKSQLIAIPASQVQAIILPQPPE